MRLEVGADAAVISAKTLARDCQEIAARFVEHRGWKKGLHLFGKAIGEGDRRARAIYAGEARQILAHEYLLAREADIALRRECCGRGCCDEDGEA